MVRGSAYAQIMRMCADNALSACIMRACLFCADYAQMRQEPYKNLTIITIRPRIGLVRLAKRYASQPHAAAPTTPGGKQRNHAKGRGGGPGGCGIPYQPLP